MRNDTKIKGRPSGEDGGGGLEQSKVSTTLKHVRLNAFVLSHQTSAEQQAPPYPSSLFPHRTTDPLAIRSHSQTTSQERTQSLPPCQ